MTKLWWEIYVLRSRLHKHTHTHTLVPQEYSVSLELCTKQVFYTESMRNLSEKKLCVYWYRYELQEIHRT